MARHEDQTSAKRNSKSSISDDMDSNSNSNSSESPQQGEKLEQLMSFVKENWKVVLTDLVTAGVNAYLTHNKREKTVDSRGSRSLANH